MNGERDHRKRIFKLCDDALKQAALGEAYGLAVEFCFAPELNEARQITGLKPAWFVVVTIPHTLVGQPDVGNGIPVFGVLPDDAALRAAAVAMLEKNRQERGQATMPVAGLSGDEIMRRMREGN